MKAHDTPLINVAGKQFQIRTLKNQAAANHINDEVERVFQRKQQKRREKDEASEQIIFGSAQFIKEASGQEAPKKKGKNLLSELAEFIPTATEPH